MECVKKLIMGLLCVVVITNAAEANKSVFIISKHVPQSEAEAFSIDGDEVTFQTMVEIGTYDQGAVGNAVWADKDLMFVTYEGSEMIGWTSTETLQEAGEFDTDVSNLSGHIDQHKNSTRL